MKRSIYFLVFFLVGGLSTLKGQSIDLINGKWKLPCFNKVDDLASYRCINGEEHEYASFDINKESLEGTMKQVVDGGPIIEAKVKIEEEGNNTFLILTYKSGTVKKGEIIQSDETTLKVVFGQRDDWRLWRR